MPSQKRAPKVPGSGRKKGTLNKATAARQAEIAKTGITPLAYILNIMRDESASKEDRMRAAVAAAPYCHPRLAGVSHSGADGGPIPHEHKLSPELHDLIERTLGRPAGSEGGAKG